MAAHANHLRNTLRILRDSGVTACEFHPDGAVRSVTFGRAPAAEKRDAIAPSRPTPRPPRPAQQAVDALAGFGMNPAEAEAEARQLGLMD